MQICDNLYMETGERKELPCTDSTLYFAVELSKARKASIDLPDAKQ